MNGHDISPVLGLIHDIHVVFDNAGPDPAKDSPADIEIRTFSRSESVKTAFFQAAIALESATDHLEALDTLTGSKQYPIAPWTCARGVLEASSLAAWLFDTQIGVRERVSRSLALRFAVLTAQRKTANSEGDGTKVGLIRSHLEALDKIADELGFPILHDKRNRRTGIAQVKPSITDLVNRQLGRGSLYRVLSGVAHSDYAVLMHVAFFPKPSEDQPEGTIRRRAVPPDLQLKLLADTAAVYARAVWLRAVQFGNDVARVAVVLESRYNELSLADTNEVRFWRAAVHAGS